MAKKDAMGTEIDSLYLSLGLNVSDLELGFETAGKTVKQAMSRLNSEANQIRLRADIDVTRLEAAGKSVEALKAREKALNDELAVQQKKLELLNRAYQANEKTYGKDSSLTRGVDTKRLYQVRDIERLKAQIAQVNGELAKTSTASTSALGTLTNGFSNVTGKVTGTVNAISKLNTAITGVVAGITAGAGIFALTDKAMKAGNDLYMLSERLRMTTGEASKLSKVFQFTGTDINTVIPFLTRLDRTAASGVKTQNSLTRAMAEYDFTLTDSMGNTLAYSQQLEQLSKAFMKAEAAGRSEDFIRDVLGARGASFVPLLREFIPLMEKAGSIQTTGLLNTEEARKLYLEWVQLQMQAGQLTSALGQALMPIASEMMPEIKTSFAEIVKQIRDNKDAIKEFGSAAGEVLGGLTSTITTLITTLGSLKKEFNELTTIEGDFSKEVLKRNGFSEYLQKGQNAGGLIGFGVGGAYGGAPGAVAGGGITSSIGESIYAWVANRLMSDEEKQAIRTREELLKQENQAFKEYNEQRKQETKETVGESVKLEREAAEVQKELETELANATSERLKEQLEAIRDKVEASIAEGKTEAAAWASVADDIKKAMKAAAKEANEANKALRRSIASMSMSDLGKSLYGVDTAAEDTLKKGADPALVAQEASLKKAKIYEQFEKEKAEYLDNIYADSLTKRLNQIEREKKAWIQKGMDEVTATRAAEAQKQQAVNDTVKNMFTSQKKYLEIYRQAMRGQVMSNGGMYDFEASQGDRQQNAIRAMRAAMMRDAGVDPWESTNMQEVHGFQQAMKEANNWGASLLGNGAGGMTELAATISESNSEVTNILGQISPEVSQVNDNLSAILGAVEQNSNRTPSINVNPTINVDLGGAYVFDNAMKQRLTDDITREVANGVTSAVQEATNRINTGYGN